MTLADMVTVSWRNSKVTQSLSVGPRNREPLKTESHTRQPRMRAQASGDSGR